MGWIARRFWDVIIVATLVALIGGAALMQAAMATGGSALGQGISGGVTFLKSLAGGFNEAEKVAPKTPNPNPSPSTTSTSSSGSTSSPSSVPTAPAGVPAGRRDVTGSGAGNGAGSREGDS